MSAVVESSIGAPLVSEVKPKPSDVVWQAHEVLAEDGILLSLNKIHKILRRMWADEAAAERKRDRLVCYQGSLRKGADRRFHEDPVGETASELVDYIRGWKVER
jgi:hypothetical protein